MLFSRPKRVGRQIREGDEAQRRGDWSTAYSRYAAVVAAKPDHAEIWVQLGHAAKELGDLDRAEEAYREAIKRGGGRSDTFVQLGHLLKLRGAREAAISAYADALHLDPDAAAPLRELLVLEARDSVPAVVFASSRRERLLAELQFHEAAAQALAEGYAAASTLPLGDYDAFRKAFPVMPPPACSPLPILVIVDARNTAPAYLRATLISLLDQSLDSWRACVRAPLHLLDHPVASFASTDQRITFNEPDAEAMSGDEDWVLMLPAGVSLDPQSLAWFAFAASITDADAFYADHDHIREDPVGGPVRSHPALQGAFDPFTLIQAAVPPPIIMVRAPSPSRAKAAPAHDHPLEAHRSLLLAVSENGPVAQIPRVLASIIELPEVACGAPLGGEAIAPAGLIGATPAANEHFTVRGGALELIPRSGLSPVLVAQPSDAAPAIRVVIPTRDAATMLRTAIDSLLARADRPDRVRLTVVDNRSKEPETLALLKELGRRGVQVLTMDEPFNWSRANNLATAASDEPYLVFVNNDTEMLTDGWDRRVIGYLQRRDVGAIGARLLYPDRTLQHGGILLFGGSPRHEGVGAASGVGGPLDRWRTTRAVAAVTGAFLATRRIHFEAVGGFDEKRLAIAFNDVDFCLKARAKGLLILYTAAIELIHFESKTRGLNDTRAKIAWDVDEFRTLRERWGDALARDPSYNPQWSAGPIPFDGLREPPLETIIEAIRGSAARHPWQVVSPSSS